MGEPTTTLGRAADERQYADVDQRERSNTLVLDLAGRLTHCSEDELRVVDQILARLEIGRERYGFLNLSADSRDWRKEEAEEWIDAAIYRACRKLSGVDK